MNKVKDSEDFMNRFRRGDPAAMKRIYDELYSSICSFIYKRIGDSVQAEDIGITTLTKCFINCSSFVSHDHIRNSLYQTAKNACIDHLRSTERKLIVQKEVEYLAQAAHLNVQHEILLNEMIDMVKGEIKALPKKTGEVIRLILEGKKPQEISQELSISTDAIKFHRSSAIKLIKHSFIRKQIIYIIIIAFFLSTFPPPKEGISPVAEPVQIKTQGIT